MITLKILFVTGNKHINYHIILDRIEHTVNHTKAIIVSSGFIEGEIFVQRELFFDWVIRVKLKCLDIGKKTINSQVCKVFRGVLRRRRRMGGF